MLKPIGKAMLSNFTNRFLSSLRPTYWDAPDHFKEHPRQRTAAEIERRIAHDRHRAMRNVGMW
jgi:hypothetical protein